MENSKKRVVVTGVGPITPVGFGKDAYWESLVRGKTSFKRLEFPGRDMDQYRSKVGAPIQGFDILHYIEKTKHTGYLGRTSQFAIADTKLALDDAGLTLEKNAPEKKINPEDGGQYRIRGIDPFQIGVVLGIGAEAMEMMEHYHEKFMARGPRAISPFGLPNIYLSAITSHVAECFTLSGTSFTPFPQPVALQPMP